MEKNTKENPLGVKPIGALLRQFAIPSIISMLVGSLYNIVDQFFIGQTVGELGNAATNIAFPMSMLCTGTALLFGIGGASAFNISMGRKEPEKAVGYMGNALTMLIVIGLTISVITSVFLKPLMVFFGSPAEVLPYAMEYTRITAIGFPAFILSIGGGHLIRADGRPKMTMVCNLTGAITNTILDAIFVFGLGWGMTGAAVATIMGQFLAGGLALWCLAHCRSTKMRLRNMLLKGEQVLRVTSLGMANCMNQMAMMVVQIVLNNSLKYYGSLSEFGESIPIACAGIISKVNMVFMSFIIGLSQGLQPIASFNYGAKKYDRVKKAYLLDIRIAGSLAVFAFCMFQIFPRQITSVFGNGSELYYKFAVNYFRIYLFFTFANFMQPISSNFFTSIGKPKGGLFLSLTRQILFLLPLILLFPLVMGIDGIMYAGPAADALAALVSAFMIWRELRREEYKIR